VARRRRHSYVDRAAATEASQWLERLPDASMDERQEFAEWLRRSPVHVRELLLSEFVDDALCRFDSERRLSTRLSDADANVVPLRNRMPASDASCQRSGGRSWRWITGVAAALTAIFVALLYCTRIPGAETYATSIGEQRTVPLVDGSVVTLNVRTELKVDFTARSRDVYLQAGQALFSVAHDSSRPFRVHVDGTTVQAVGTKFDVRRAGTRTLVYVVEGRVRIEQPELAALRVSPVQSPSLPPVELTPGEAAAIRQDGEVAPSATVDMRALSAWQNRRLIFEERPLAEIADEFSSYVRSPKLIVEGMELRARLYTGSFDADRLDGFIAYLERDPSLEVIGNGDSVIVRPATR
jgi:transmembrane sensor